MGEKRRKEMGRAEQDETLAWRGKSRCAARLRALVYLATLIKKHRTGWGETKRKEMGKVEQDEMLWDADKEGKVTLRRSLACARLPGHPDQKA